jgi:hypothetical protein
MTEDLECPKVSEKPLRNNLTDLVVGLVVSLSSSSRNQENRLKSQESLLILGVTVNLPSEKLD